MVLPSAYIAYPSVEVSGQINDELSHNLFAAMIEETVDGLYRCEMTFNNFGNRRGSMDYLFFDRDALDFGKDVTLLVGPGDDATAVFKGRITALEGNFPNGGGAHLIALAEDRLQDLRMTRRTRSFEDMSDQDIVDQIARDHSLTADLSMPGPTHRSITQLNLSDLAFIRECARRVDAELWVEDTTLFAKTRRDRGSDTVTLEYGVSLIGFTVRADLAHQCTEVIIGGWDVASKDAIKETAEENAIRSELGDGDSSGGSILDDKFGARPHTIVHRVPLTTEEARGIAEACYRERSRRFLTGTGMADGNQAIRVGKLIDISGLGDLFNGTYYVTRVTHSYDMDAGFRTEFDVERAGIGAA